MTDRPDGRTLQPLSPQELPRPEPAGPFDVVVRIAAAGVCRSDLHILMGELPVSVPHVLGHENSGWVHAAGPMVSTVEVGQAVLCYPFVSDGLSAPERRGVDSAAPGRRTPGIDCDGGYAEYLLVTERSLVPLPDDADLAAMATLTDAGLAAYRACRKAAATLGPDSLAVVTGVGGLGHLAVQILRSVSAARVLAVDTRPEARELAGACGAHATCSPDEFSAAAGSQVDAVIDFVGSDESAASALASLGFGGSYFAVGVGGAISSPILRVVANETRIEGVYVGTYPELVELTNLTLRGDVRPVVVSYPLSDADRALRDLAAGAFVGRAVLIP
jgi:NAD+-dependent secondary alcohol dehydrogenase Adh1